MVDWNNALSNLVIGIVIGGSIEASKNAEESYKLAFILLAVFGLFIFILINKKEAKKK